MDATMHTAAVRDARIDALVAQYAPIGRRQKRQNLLRRGLLASLGLAIVIPAALLTISLDRPNWSRPVAAVAPAQQAASGLAEIVQLKSERDAFESRLNQVESQLAMIHGQRDELDTQRATLEVQSTRLADLLEQMSSEQLTLESRRAQGASLDREIEALAAQREALADRWEQFEAQGELLALEITAVNQQRRELESQRRLLDQQQRSLAELLDRAEGLYRRAAGAAGDTDTPAVETDEIAETSASEDSFTYTYNSLVADVNDMVVENGQLDRMRGGFSVGDGLDVSIGFTQTGAINGVEQFQNNFTIDSMANGFESVDMSNMNSVVLQNGSGNFVSPSVLDSLERNFGTIIQNTLDDQVISTTTVYDISLENVPGAIQGLAGEQALFDSLGSFR